MCATCRLPLADIDNAEVVEYRKAHPELAKEESEKFLEGIRQTVDYAEFKKKQREAERDAERQCESGHTYTGPCCEKCIHEEMSREKKDPEAIAAYVLEHWPDGCPECGAQVWRSFWIENRSPPGPGYECTKKCGWYELKKQPERELVGVA